MSETNWQAIEQYILSENTISNALGREGFSAYEIKGILDAYKANNPEVVRLRTTLEQIASYEAQADISPTVRNAYRVRIAKAAIDWEQGPAIQ